MLLECSVGHTSALRRSDRSGWYERASIDRGRCLSTSNAIVVG